MFSIIIAILILLDELTIDAEIIFFLSITLDVDQNLIATTYAKFIFRYTGFDRKNAIHQQLGRERVTNFYAPARIGLMWQIFRQLLFI